MPRYVNTEVIPNSSEYYSFLRRERGDMPIIRHYATPRLRNPGVLERAATHTTTHMWKYGDRYYNLANKHYGDTRYWWVIAWWNGLPTEADIYPGDVIQIPVDLETTLRILGAA
tara:strand:- start:46 stop:387 length:342 start_codon:yes stop_codon:yes gene_type:complete